MGHNKAYGENIKDNYALPPMWRGGVSIEMRVPTIDVVFATGVLSV